MGNPAGEPRLEDAAEEPGVHAELVAVVGSGVHRPSPFKMIAANPFDRPGPVPARARFPIDAEDPSYPLTPL